MIETKCCSSTRANDRADVMRDFAVAGNKICVQVGIKNIRQLNPKLGRGMQVPVYVTQRVDQYPFFRVVRTDQIGRVAESRIHKGFDKIIRHDASNYKPKKEALRFSV